MKRRSRSNPQKKSRSDDFLSACQRRAEAEGLVVDEVVWAAMKALFAEAAAGDVSAAKLLLEYLFDPPGEDANAAGEEESGDRPAPVDLTTPTTPDNATLVDHIKQMEELVEELQLSGVQVG